MKLGREKRASKKDHQHFQTTAKRILDLVLKEEVSLIYLTSFQKHLLVFSNKTLQEWDLHVMFDLLEMMTSRISQEGQILEAIKKEAGL